jgi:hypothetical protein
MPTSEGAAPSSPCLHPSLSAAMQGGGLVFVVDDVVFTYFVLPYAKRLLGKGQDQFYDWLDAQGIKLARRGWRVWRHKPSQVEVLTDLGHYVEKHPGTAGTLTAAAIAGPVTDEEFLRTIRDFLTRIFEMVQELGHPAVLPGFLTGTNYLAIIDVRTPHGTQLEMPEMPWMGGPDEPEIKLWNPLPPAGVLPHWMPRLWLVSTADGELARDPDTTLGQLAAALAKFASDPETTPVQLAAKLEDQSFVTGITRHHVVVKHARMPLERLTPVTAGESSRIPWAESPDGVKDMLEALTSQLGERKKHEELWRQALAQP